MASDRGGKVTGEVPVSVMPSRSRRLSNSMSNSRRESFNYPSAGFGTNPLESVSRQSNHDYDEDALRWAALEKLPTYDRIRTSVFQKHTGSVRHVDVKDLSSTDFQYLLDKVHRNQDDENEQLVFKMRKRLDRVGIELPTVEVRYEDLSIQADCYVGDRGLPTLLNASRNLLESILGLVHLAPTKKKVLTILDNVSGVIKPGRMTLLLGPPSSGKTTLLLKLAGKLDSSLRVKGSVTFNGHTHDEFVPQKTALYVSQNDLHNGELTVRETLDFSARMHGVGTQYHLLEEVVKREKEAGIRPEPDVDTFMKATALPGSNGSLAVEYVLAMLGLDICADTMIGDQMRRGISGGQKKRVTTGEMIVGPTKVLFMDEISTGLDSSTTFSIVKSLSRFAHAMSGTVLVSLLQPAPETFALFDDVLLLSEGQVVYHGPIGNVMEFFESCGFKLPDRKGIADFLQEVTSRKDQEQYWADKTIPYHFISVREFSEAFRHFHVGVKLYEDLAVPYPKDKSHPAALAMNRYSIPKLELLKIYFQRERVLQKRNAVVLIVKAVQITVGGFVSMTSFFRTRLHQDTVGDGVLYVNALFFAIIIFFFTGFGELAGTIKRLPVLIKHRDMLLSPAWAYTLSTMILSLPSSLVEVGIYSSMTYFVTGYAPNAGRFFKYYLVLFMIQQQAGGMFRFIAGLCRTDTLAFTLGWIMILLFFMLGGFIIPRPEIPVWWRWAYWVTNMAYAEEAASVNELTAPRWQKPNPADPSTPLGVAVLESRGLFPYSYWYWIGIGGLAAFYVLFNVAFTLSLGFMPAIGKPQPIMSEEELAEKEAARTGSSMPKSASQAQSRSLSKAKSSQRRSLSLSAARSAKGEAPVQMMRSRRVSKAFSENEHGVAESEDMVVDRGMILPFQPLSISFDDICYYVDMPAEMKSAEVTESKLQLLSGITGAFRPGVLTALVGVSGAGKTTLMDVLAGRKSGGYIEGDIRISGYPKNQKTFARISGYCEQNDIHSPQTTVREALIYSAWLRLASEIDDSTKMAFVEEVLELVELKQLENALVGLPGISGLSTEQRKRLTISVELVANPSIIFMDEPTSGLDARAAAIVMRTVRNTVDTGRTVVCTIHQPSIDIFEAFDELLLLKRGGRVIYAGELGRYSQNLVDYFQAFPGIPKITNGYNPATWMLEVSNIDKERELGVDFADLYLKSSLYGRNKQLVRDLSEPTPGSKDLYFPTQYPLSFLNQLRCVLWKQNITYWRSPHYNLVRYGFTLLTALICGSIFWRVGQKYSSSRQLTTTIGALYGATLFLCFNNAQTVQPMVSIERSVHYREKGAGLYSSAAYALAQLLIEIPYVFIQGALYSLITYAMLNFEWTAAKFFWYFYIECTSLITFTFYGMMMVSITPNLVLATVTSTFFYTVFNLYSGFLIPRPYIPGWWIWYYWFDPVAWSVYGLVASQYGDIGKHLDVIGVVGASGTTVKQYLQTQFGFKHDFLKVVGPIMFLWPVFFGGIFVLAVKKLNFQRR